MILAILGGARTHAAGRPHEVVRNAPSGRLAKRQVSTTPVYRTGPDGAIHLDRPVIIGQPTQIPAIVAPPPAVPGTTVPMAPPAVTSSPVVVSPVVPQTTQPMAMQPAWQQPAVAPRLPRWLRPFEKDFKILRRRTRRQRMYPMIGHRSGGFGGYLYLRPRDAEVAFAQPIGGPVPIGPTLTVDPQYETGFYAGGAFAFDETSSLAVTYRYFRSNTRTSATDDDIRSLVTHPESVNTASDVQDVSARLDINYDIIDADFRSILYGETTPEGGACAVNWVVGARYAELEEVFRSTFAVPGAVIVDSNLRFRGGGIRAGLESERHACATRFFAYGRGFTSLLFGEYDARYRQTSSFIGTEAFTTWSGSRVTPVVDLEVGVGWLGPREHLRLSIGYVVSAWLNTISTDAFVDAVRRDNFVGLGDDVLTFDGFAARADLQF